VTASRVAGMLLARVLLTGMLAGMVLTACGQQPPPKRAPVPPPTIIGPAPAAATGHIRTDQPVDAYTGYAQPDQWPSACDLLTDADLHAVFPQLTGKVQRTASKQGFQFPDGGTFDVPDAHCTMRFKLPGDTADRRSEIDTAIEALGEPGLVAQNGADQQEAAPSCAYHAAPVADVATDYVCGRIEFSVDLHQFSLPTWGTNYPDRFEVNGTITSFRPAGSVAQVNAESAFEDAHIAPPLVTAVIQKLPAS
jgi:hypothetical protein